VRTTCPELLHGSGADANRTHDLSITSPTTYHCIKIEITAVKVLVSKFLVATEIMMNQPYLWDTVYYIE